MRQSNHERGTAARQQRAAGMPLSSHRREEVACRETLRGTTRELDAAAQPRENVILTGSQRVEFQQVMPGTAG